MTGCTTVTPPNRDGLGTPAIGRVYFDSRDHPLETDSPLQTASGNKNYSLYAYDSFNNLIWTEDGLGNPTDNTYDSFNHSLLTSTGPDPDGAGSLTAPTTTYRYDESNLGTATTAGTALQGLQASYYSVSDLTGYPAATQNDPNVDSTVNWGGAGLPAVVVRPRTFLAAGRERSPSRQAPMSSQPQQTAAPTSRSTAPT